MIKGWALKRYEWVWLAALLAGANFINNTVKNHMGRHNPILRSTPATLKVKPSIKNRKGGISITGNDFRIQRLKHLPLISSKNGTWPNITPIND